MTREARALIKAHAGQGRNLTESEEPIRFPAAQEDSLGNGYQMIKEDITWMRSQIRFAQDKNLQVKIFAQLYDCGTEDIKELLCLQFEVDEDSKKNTKLTDEYLKEVVAKRKAGMSLKDLQLYFGKTKNAIAYSIHIAKKKGLLQDGKKKKSSTAGANSCRAAKKKAAKPIPL